MPIYIPAFQTHFYKSLIHNNLCRLRPLCDTQLYVQNSHKKKRPVFTGRFSVLSYLRKCYMTYRYEHPESRILHSRSPKG